MTAPTEHGVDRPTAGEVVASMCAASDYLLSRQDPRGFWKGELRTNVTMDAEDLLLRAFLGILDPADLDAAARWIRSEQHADGTWSNFLDGTPDHSTTVEAYVALKLAGDPLDAPHMVAAREQILARGGLETTRVFTRIWMALFGQWSWDDLPVMPPELIRFTPSMPLNVYDWACWARQTVVALLVVATHRPVRELGFDIDELRTGATPGEKIPGTGWKRFFQTTDKLLHLYEKSPVKPLRASSLKLCLEWILARQEADGGWGGIQPPWVYSILALTLSGYSLDHPAVAKAIAGLEGFLIREDTPDGPVRRLEACQSPVWDTCLAVIALADAGVPADHPAMLRAGRWMLDEEVTVRGDWAVARPDLAVGGWAFEFANDIYPDVDDTAVVVLSLRHLMSALPEAKPAIDRGIEWGVGMRSADGGWGAFDADNTSPMPNRVPFSDFGAVIDPPSADVTAHMVEMLARFGRVEDPVTRGGVDWLLAHQEPDGSWFGRWGANYVYGTGAVVPALVEAGVSPESAAVRRAVDWLVSHQNADGGWGEDLRSYDDPSQAGRGESTPSQTGWALLALIAAGEDSPAVHHGVRYLVSNQQVDGGWAEYLYTGTGFPGYFYINYEMYRHVFPLSALGRYARRFGYMTDLSSAPEKSGSSR